ncbi:MAG: hypothetical protein LBQ42_02420 [Synergistaceae bacterium]|nr:hypothetical protein [Synergistaceae bacterium]
MIESFIEGRVRLRSPLLADEAFVERLRSELLKIDGIYKAEANPRTNSLLLEYDKKRLPLSLLKQAAPLFTHMDNLTKLPAENRLSALEDFIGRLRETLFPTRQVTVRGYGE